MFSLGRTDIEDLKINKVHIFGEIEIVEVNRNKKYHSFVNLAKLNNDKKYLIYVEAEDKSGEIIDRSDLIATYVDDIPQPYNGW